MKKKWNMVPLSRRRHKIVMIMKLLFLFNLCCLLSVSASSLSQVKVLNLEVKDAKIKDVLDMIEKQSDVSFFYQIESLDVNKKISVEYKNAKLTDVLDKLLIGTDLTYRIMDQYVAIFKKPSQDSYNNQVEQEKQITVTGKVSDDKGDPIPGVNVFEQSHPTNGVISGVDGSYSITVSAEDAVLTYSFIGFNTQEVQVAGRSDITVTLVEEFIGLDEVVAIGYGYQKKVNLTGAVDQISSDKIASRPSANVSSALQGMMPGLNVQPSSGDPRNSAKMNIRGFNSINGGSPLVLVDGIAGDIDRLNPNDIETITVLKDASSAAIYGARGAFGVILVTTKKGASGDVVIDYSNNLGFTSPTTRTDYISDPYLYGKTVDAAIYGYNGSSYTGYDEGDWETIQKVSSGEIEPFHELQGNGKNKFFYNTNWYDYLFRDVQSSQSHNISLSGGTDKVKAYLSGRYYSTNTIQKIVDEKVNRYNMKANISFQATDWLEVSNNIQYNTGDDIEYGGRNKGWGDTWTYTKNWLMAFMPYEIDGVPYDYRGESTHAALENGNNWTENYYKEFINTVSAKITPFKGMVVNFDYSHRANHMGEKTRLNTFDYLTGSSISMRTVGLNRLTERRIERNFNAVNLYGTYERSFFEDHNFKVMAGFNQEDFDEDIILAEQGGLFNENYANLNLGTELLRADGSTNLWAVRGYFGRLNYDYKGRYLLELNGRYDGSSRFPSEGRWGFFPSVSGGWHLSRENFWAPLQDVVSTFKLRASYGQLGNQNVPLDTFSQLLPVGTSNWLVDGAQINEVRDPEPMPGVVTWEKTSTIDYGFDIGFMNNKLLASFDYFDKMTTDMYLPGEPLPSVFGADEPRENIADLSVKGIEISIGYNNSFDVAGSPLKFGATFSLSNFKGIITKYDNPEGVLSTFYEGQELGEIWGYRVDGQFQSDAEAAEYQNSFDNPSKDLGQVYDFAINIARNDEWKGLRAGDVKYVDVNGDGEISKGNNTLDDHGDLEKIGNAMPKFPFGFSFSADWKGFDFSMAGAGVVSQDWYPTGKLYWGTYERPYVTFIRKDLVENAWSPENTSGKYPQINRGYTSLKSNRQLGAVNDYYLTNVGYLRVKNITLGYTLPKAWTKKANIERLRVYFSGENLFTIRFGDLTKYIDPEQAGSGISFNDPGDATDRSDVNGYPMGKIVSFGINLTL